MTKNEVVKKVYDYVEAESHDDSAHDWWHIWRVYHLSRKIAKIEKGDVFVVSMIALLHDVYDWKMTGVGTDAEKELRDLLKKLRVSSFVDDKTVREICYNSAHLGWSENMFGQVNELSPNGKIAQDADRLDAIGAIGIARCLSFQGGKERVIYNPNWEIYVSKTKEDYQKFHENLHMLNHFYEKLLKIRDHMNTGTGKKMAEGRHKYIEGFLEEFYAEWESER